MMLDPMVEIMCLEYARDSKKFSNKANNKTNNTDTYIKNTWGMEIK